MTLKAISPALIARFATIVGEANAIVRAEDQARYLREWRDLYVGRTPIVLRPGTTDEVSRILALAHDENIGVVTQGGNTGLVGGQIPSSENTEIVLSTERLRAVRGIDVTGGTMTLEAGVALAEAQTIAETAGRLFPLSLASEGSATIGGVLATNAGGTAVLAYGNARNLCLGVEAVLADGRVYRGLKKLKKDNAGYDLRDLLIGSEGTLGVITAATLRLLARPTETATAIVALDSPQAAVELLERAEASGHLTAFEVWRRDVQDLALRHMPGVRDAFAEPHLWYALIELSSPEAGGRAAAQLEGLLAAAQGDCTIRDAAIAHSMGQAQQFWKLRDSFSEAQKGAGASIKHDVSVPIARIPEFLERADGVVERICPGARPVPFGHFGDGNLHYNVSQPVGMDRAAYLALWNNMSDAIHALVSEMEGSIAAEHGVGQMKRSALARFKTPVELDMMRAIKFALDPKGILNPGKTL
ncbi:MAG: FAD-binding oxidoreductase [Hyphomicrobium sp.]